MQQSDQHNFGETDDADHPDSADDVGFEVSQDYLARPPRKPPEPGLMRTLFIAMLVGVTLGTVLYYFKPTPRSAEARPAVLPPKMMNAAPTPSATSVDLFQLPEWDEAAYQRDLRAAPQRQ